MALPTGEKYERLTVVGPAEPNREGRARVQCRCECGTRRIVAEKDLKSGNTRSCGCLMRDKAREHAKSLTVLHVKHGGAAREGQHPLYWTWVNMRRRCRDPKATAYHRYGGRGITVCERWDQSFPDFLADMGEKPGPEYSIDRIDPDGNYEPANCRWATPKQQTDNRSDRKVAA